MIDIRKAYELYDEAADQVKMRWQNLIGFGCGWFNSYEISDDKVIIRYGAPRSGSSAVDIIPITYFEMEDEEEARKMWKELLEEQRKEKEDANNKQKEDREKAQFERLKKKYG